MEPCSTIDVFPRREAAKCCFFETCGAIWVLPTESIFILVTKLFFFFIHVGCLGQLTRTTTIPHSPLDILQAQEQVRHRGGDRRAHRGSNPGGGAEQVHDGPQQLNPQVLGTHEGSNQGTQAGQSLPRPLSYKPRVWLPNFY